MSSTVETSLYRSKSAPIPLSEAPLVPSSASASSRPAIRRTGPSARRKAATKKPGPHKPVPHRVTFSELREEYAYKDVSTRAGGRAVSLSPLTSPRHDVREDPFSLGGFFPSSPSSSSPATEWAWLSPPEDLPPDVDEGLDGVDEEPVESDMPQRSLSMNALDDYAREVIANEDRLGILSLRGVRMPSFFASIGANYFGDETSEPSVATPSSRSLSLDEPLDADTLYESLRLRRAASQSGLAALPEQERVLSFGLFSPTAESQVAELGWAGSLYTKILGAA